MLNFDIQNHRPLREMVYEELKMQILTGTIVPGTRMMEVELAEEMGVSRTPIREAIRKLEKEGLVTIEPRRGALTLRRSRLTTWWRSWKYARTWRGWLRSLQHPA